MGANVSHDLPPHLARLKALEAAEKRKQTTRILGSGGRLGGRTANAQGMSPRELAAQVSMMIELSPIMVHEIHFRPQSAELVMRKHVARANWLSKKRQKQQRRA